MANQTGIAITIKAFLPTGRTIDEQFTALGMVKDAHASGDYSQVLAASQIEEVKSEQKTRRISDTHADAPADAATEDAMLPTAGPGDTPDDADVPAFVKGKKTPQANAA